MRRYRPTWVESYKWDYALGLIKNYDTLVTELHGLEGARLGYAKPSDGMPRGSKISDPTYQQATRRLTPSPREIAIAKRLEVVEQAWMTLREDETEAMKLHIFENFTYSQLIARGFPFSATTLKRIKGKLIYKVVRDLCL